MNAYMHKYIHTYIFSKINTYIHLLFFEIIFKMPVRCYNVHYCKDIIKSQISIELQLRQTNYLEKELEISV